MRTQSHGSRAMAVEDFFGAFGPLGPGTEERTWEQRIDRLTSTKMIRDGHASGFVCPCAGGAVQMFEFRRRWEDLGLLWKRGTADAGCCVRQGTLSRTAKMNQVLAAVPILSIVTSTSIWRLLSLGSIPILMPGG